MLEDGKANDALGSTQGIRPAFRVVQPKRIHEVDNIGIRAVELGERVSAEADDAAMVEGTLWVLAREIGWLQRMHD